MSDHLEKLIAGLPADKREILAELISPEPDPIAIVGLGCRFPGGVDSPESLWNLLARGVDTITEVPADRWNIDDYFDPDVATPGKMSTRFGAFLDRIDQFDAPFFGISPREAARMDPQQRLLLEVCWEALEDGGQTMEGLAGSQTGIFFGVVGVDYFFLQAPDIRAFDGHTGLGGCHSIATGRLSYWLDLHGPNMAVDTACSSSLVAVHLACQSLRNKECRQALAGGVNLMIAPHATVFLSKWGMMAPDGRCKTFDSRANGIVRGEGVGVVVLKRLRDAVADGDNIQALIRGSAINQDGRGTRLSAPNVHAQKAVIRKALEIARVSPNQISYIEAHGTGTPVGDPIEIEALTEVVGQPRAGGPSCAIGSIKTNLGHTEATAGVAGLIKAVLCLQKQAIPPHLHLRELNSAIHFENTPFFVPTELSPWPEVNGPRLAAVSSFGLSGTNSHVILEEAPQHLRTEVQTGQCAYLLPLSARSESALVMLAERYRDFLAPETASGQPGAAIHDICYTAAVRRSHHPCRMAVVGRSPAELAGRLGDWLSQRQAADADLAGSSNAGKLVFVFSGQGSQYAGMARRLLAQEPIFRDTVEQCAAVTDRLAKWSLLDELAAEESRSRLSRTEIAQPAIFAVQAGLIALLRSHGVAPDAVVGHSAGEIAAAHAAGALSLDEAVRVVFHRARLMQQAAGQGRMAAIGLTADETRQAIARYDGQLAVAAINGPQSTVIAGEAGPLAEALDALKGRGVFCRDLGVDYAFHTHHMEPHVAPLCDLLRGLELHAETVPIISTVTGRPVQGVDLQPDHWAKNMRQPVQFAAAIDHLLAEGPCTFLEIGPHPVLATPLTQCIAQRGEEGRVLATLRQGQEERASVLRSLAGLYAAGHDLDFRSFYPQGGRCVRLPAYPWQHRRYWIQPPSATAPPNPVPSGAIPSDPLPSNSVPPASNPPVTKSLPNQGIHKMPAPSSPAADRSNGRAVDLSDHNQRRELVGKFYDLVTTPASEQASNEAFLTFAPFLEIVPGFSWVRAFYEQKECAHQWNMVVEAQKQMREILFRGIDFSAIRAVLDFGCGYGSDVCRLAQLHPHLRADGYTVSALQAQAGNEKIVAQGMQDRTSIYRRDSSQDEFPGQYDLVFGFEVAPYIKDKHKLFSNIDRHLSDSGYVVLADFVANTVSEIGHDETSSYIITKEEWTSLLTPYKLRIVDCVNVSREISNFLYDPGAEQHLVALSQKMTEDGHIRKHFTSYDKLGRMLDRKLVSYVLLRIQKDPYRTKEEIARINFDKLTHQTPYAEAVRQLELRPQSPTAPSPIRPRNNEWLYEVKWQAAPRRRRQDSAIETPGSWLILADQGGIGDTVAELLRSRGETCVTVSRGGTFGSTGPDAFTIDPSRPEDFRELLADALTSEMPECRGVIHLWSLDAAEPRATTLDSLQSDQVLGCESLLHLVQAVAQVQWNTPPRLWLATSASQPVLQDEPVAIAQSAQWGLGRTIAAENASLWGGMVDLDPAASPLASAAQIVDEALLGDGEDQVAFRARKRYVARLVRLVEPASAASAVSVRSDGSYLITGGLGDLGLEVAHWLASQGARHLVLMQRSPLPPRDRWPQAAPGSRAARQIAAIQKLEAAGVKVRLASLDAADASAVQAFLAQYSSSGSPAIRGVVHAAGIAEAGPLSDLNADALRRVMRPKMNAAWVLQSLLQDAPLDFFVLFSSASSVLRSPFIGGYAAANTFLDALAAHRRSAGQPALSINWGVWGDVGMAARHQQQSGRDLTPRGMTPIAPQQGVELLGDLLSSQAAQVGVIPMNWAQLAECSYPLLAELAPRVAAPAPARQPAAPAEQRPQTVSPRVTMPPKVVEPAGRPPQPSQSPASEPRSIQSPASQPAARPTQQPESSRQARAASPAGLRQSLLAAGPPQRRKLLENYLREQTARILQLPAADLDFRQPLNRMGIDSLMAVELRNILESELGVSVQLVKLLEGSSLADLSKTLLADLPSPAAQDPDRLAAAMAQVDSLSDDAVAELLAQKRLIGS